MPREAQHFVFNDGIGRDIYKYTGNDKKFLDFLDWYTNFCRCSNEILFVIGEQQSGRSTFLSHCFNFLERKANYEILKIRGLYEAADEYSILPCAKTEWLLCTGLSGADIPAQICRLIVKEQIVSQMLSRAKASITFSQGPGSPEITAALGLSSAERVRSVQNLINYLKNHCNNKYVIWLKSLRKEDIPILTTMHQELKSMGVDNLGIVVSMEPCNEVLSMDDIRIIAFDSITIEEAAIFIAIACREADNDCVRFDMEVADLLLKGGCNTFGKLRKKLLSIEKLSSYYISAELAKQVMQEESR